METGRKGIEQADKETARYVDRECGPREENGGDATMKQGLDGKAHQAAEPSSQKNSKNDLSHEEPGISAAQSYALFPISLPRTAAVSAACFDGGLPVGCSGLAYWHVAR